MLSRALLDYRIGFDFKHIFFAEQIIKSYLLGIYRRGALMRKHITYSAQNHQQGRCLEGFRSDIG